MSYADAAASGPSQSPEEARAPPVPEVANTVETASSGSLVDVDSSSVRTVPSDFPSQEIKTETQATRIEGEEKAAAAKSKAKAKAADAKSAAKAKGKEAKGAAQRVGQNLSENRGNPVYVGNAVAVALVGAVVGFVSYQRVSKGEMDWKVAGTIGGGVLAFGVVDGLVSRWLLENKYPAK